MWTERFAGAQVGGTSKEGEQSGRGGEVQPEKKTNLERPFGVIQKKTSKKKKTNRRTERQGDGLASNVRKCQHVCTERNPHHVKQRGNKWFEGVTTPGPGQANV